MSNKEIFKKAVTNVKPSEMLIDNTKEKMKNVREYY